MPQAFVPQTTASLLTSVFEQLWRWLRGWFGQPEAAALLSDPPAGRVWRSYYFVGSQRIALREQTSADPTGQVTYLLSDHLGSTTALVSHSGVVLTAQRYSSWGQTRAGSVSTGYQYTGQRNTALGIYYYGARFYDPYLNRFLSPNPIIQDLFNPLDWDRYAYTRNNPVNYTDPTGYDVDCAVGESGCRTRVNIEKQIPYPDDMCQRNTACVAAYYTLIELSVQSGHVLSDKEILTMTADTEYTTYASDERVHPMLKEGMARQYWETFEACIGPGRGRCSPNNKIHMFMAGFEAFFDTDMTASQRATFILQKTREASQGTNRDIIQNDVKDILNLDKARLMGWNQGAIGDRPWQWKNMPYAATAEQALASPWVDGSYLWIVSFSQNVALNSR